MTIHRRRNFRSEHALDRSEHVLDRSEDALDYCRRRNYRSEHALDRPEHVLDRSEDALDYCRRRNYRSEHALDRPEHVLDRSEDALDHCRSRRSMNLFESTRRYPFDYSFGRPHSIERYFEKRPVQGTGSSSYTDNREFDYYLNLRINEVVGFDQPCPAFDPNRPSNEGVRHYILVLSVYPEVPKSTKYAQVNSSLNRANPPEFRFKLDRESYERATMKLELMRASCYGEMGASNGSVVVGRAIVKLSKAAKEIGKVKDMSSDLVRMLENGECRMEGVVRVSMKVSKFLVEEEEDDEEEDSLS